jgi:hypothetical protein
VVVNLLVWSVGDELVGAAADAAGAFWLLGLGWVCFVLIPSSVGMVISVIMHRHANGQAARVTPALRREVCELGPAVRHRCGSRPGRRSVGGRSDPRNRIVVGIPSHLGGSPWVFQPGFVTGT